MLQVLFKAPPIDVFKYPKGAEKRQRGKLTKLRESRDNGKVDKALKNLEEACKSDTNIVPYCVECARQGCTEGEIFKVFKKAYGLWKPPVFF